MTDLSPIDLILRGMTDAELREHVTHLHNVIFDGIPPSLEAYMEASVSVALNEIIRRDNWAEQWAETSAYIDRTLKSLGITDPNPPITVTDLRGETHDVAARARAWPNT